MKKLILLTAIILSSIVSHSQLKGEYAKISKYIILRGDTISHFYTITPDDTIVSKSYVDALLDNIPGGHSPVTIGTNGTTAGLSVTGQELNQRAASTAVGGYMPASGMVDLAGKISVVTHNNTLTGNGTVASPLGADTATYIVSKPFLANQNYIKRSALDWDSLANQPTIPVISNIPYDASFNNNMDGLTKNVFYDKIESLAGGHTPVTLSAGALSAGLTLSTQEIGFQFATPGQNGALKATDYARFNKDTSAFNELQNLQQVTDIGNTVVKTATATTDSTYLMRTSITQTTGSATNKFYNFKNYTTYSGSQPQKTVAGVLTFVNHIGTGLVEGLGGVPMTMNIGENSSTTNIYGFPAHIYNRGKFNKLAGHSSWIYNYNRDAANNDAYGTVSTFHNYGFLDDYSGFQVDAYNEGEMGSLDGLLVGLHGDSLDYMTGVNLGGYVWHEWTGSPKYTRGIFIDRSIDKGTLGQHSILSESRALNRFYGNFQLDTLRGTGNRLVFADATGLFSATKKDSVSYWNQAYADKINSATFNASDGVVTLTQQDAETITFDIDGRYIQSESQTLSIDSSATTYGITISNPTNRIHFNKGLFTDAGSNTYLTSTTDNLSIGINTNGPNARFLSNSTSTTAIEGIATSGTGVMGLTTSGYSIYGTASTGTAGYFQGGNYGLIANGSSGDVVLSGSGILSFLNISNTPSYSATYGKLYSKNDNKLYYLTSNNIEYDLTNTGTGSQTMTLDSVPGQIGITLSGGNRVHFNVGGGTGGGSSNLFLTGYVNDRNVNVMLDHTPVINEILTIYPDAAIAIGDTITVSINNGTPYNIFEYVEHDLDYALNIVWGGSQWFLWGGYGEGHFVKGVNTGDGFDSDSMLADVNIVTNDNSIHINNTNTGITIDSTGIKYSGISESYLGDSALVPRWWVEQYFAANIANNGTQTLVGTTPQWNVANGKNAAITLIGTTTITLSNLVDGMEGSLYVTNGGNTDYRITFAGYSVQIYPSVWYSGDQVAVSGSTKNDVFSYKYVGGGVNKLVINGALDIK